MTILDEEIFKAKAEDSNVRKIGIIDDEPGQVRLFKEMLMSGSRFDLRFREFFDPITAIEQVTDVNGYDLILIDFHLGSTKDGAEVVQALREEEHIVCPLVIFSIDVESIKRIRLFKDTFILPKPADADPIGVHNFCQYLDALIDKHDTNASFADIRHIISKMVNQFNIFNQKLTDAVKNSNEKVASLKSEISGIKSDVHEIKENVAEVCATLKSCPNPINIHQPPPPVFTENGMVCASEEITVKRLLDDVSDLILKRYNENYKSKILIWGITKLWKILWTIVGLIMFYAFGPKIFIYIKPLLGFQ